MLELITSSARPSGVVVMPLALLPAFWTQAPVRSTFVDVVLAGQRVVAVMAVAAVPSVVSVVSVVVAQGSR